MRRAHDLTSSFKTSGSSDSSFKASGSSLKAAALSSNRSSHGNRRLESTAARTPSLRSTRTLQLRLRHSQKCWLLRELAAAVAEDAVAGVVDVAASKGAASREKVSREVVS